LGKQLHYDEIRLWEIYYYSCKPVSFDLKLL
jgi:hypothetical protein